MAQNSNVANAYHTKSLADKVWWSRWREVKFMLEGWAIAYRRCSVVVPYGGCWQCVAQNSNVANAYDTKSLADKVQLVKVDRGGIYARR